MFNMAQTGQKRFDFSSQWYANDHTKKRTRDVYSTVPLDHHGLIKKLFSEAVYGGGGLSKLEENPGKIVPQEK
jgi:hypothetical protein